MVLRTLVDMWTDVDTNRRRILCDLCSKMPLTANLRIFLHKPIAGSLTWLLFPAGGLVPLETCLHKTEAKVQEK